MKVKLEHGAELDFVSPAELAEIVRKEQLGGPQRTWPTNGVVLDSSGNGSIVLVEVPADRTFTLHRLVLIVDTYTVASPYTNNSGYAEIHRNDRMVDFVSFSVSAGGLPAVGTWGDENGPHYAQREKVVIKIFGGPASGQLLAFGQGTLEPRPAES